jgi:hypothetical protein
MKHTRSLVTIATGTALVALAAAQPWSSAQENAASSGPREVVEIGDARLKFEINSTDLDGGIQVFLDADAWQRMSIFDPRGKRIFTSTTKGVMGQQGGTELFLESAEPTFDEVSLEEMLARWPAGEYAFRGVGLEGERYVGSATLTHDLPAGPELVSPLEDGVPPDPDATVVRWHGVPAPNGSPIIGYQVLVVQPDTGLTALPKVVLDVMMPPDARQLRVPPGFLLPDTEYEWEVLAVESGGNQTLSSNTFTTAD